MLKVLQASDQHQVQWFSRLPWLHWEIPFPFLNFLPSRFTSDVVPRKDLALYQSKVKTALAYLQQAWEHGNQADAGTLLAHIYLYGNYSVAMQPQRAFHLFRALRHTPGAHLVDVYYHLGFFYATNYGHVLHHIEPTSVKPPPPPPPPPQAATKTTDTAFEPPAYSSYLLNGTQQHRAHLYFQLAAAYGNHTLAEFTMAYRYALGIGCAPSCQKSLPYFYRVATKVMQYFYTGPPGGHTLPSSALRLYLEDGGLFGPGSMSSKSSRSDSAITEEDAFEYYKYLADNGDIESQYILGISFYLGTESVARHYLRSLRYLTLAANTPFEGNEPLHHKILAAKAAGLIGRMYLRGEGVPANNGTAKRWFLKGSQHHDPQSMTYLAILTLDEAKVSPNTVSQADVDRAVESLTVAAKQDFPDALSYLGRYYFGLENYVKASRLLSYASRHGNLPAMYQLAEIYERGLGVPQNCKVANMFYRGVAEKGYEWLRPQMETAYQLVGTNRELALLMYWMAAERGQEVAQCNVAWMLDQEPSQWAPKGVALAQWVRAANQENGLARVKVGDAYYAGQVVEQNYATAASYYAAAAEFEQNAIGMWNLAYMYEHGLGVPHDYHLAKRFYDRSVETLPEAWLPVAVSLGILHLTHPLEYLRVAWGTPLAEQAAPQTAIEKLETEPPIDAEDWHYRDVQKESAKNPRPSTSPTRSRRKRRETFWTQWISWLHSNSGGGDDDDDDELETYLILALCILVGYLVYLRQLHFTGQARQNNRAPPLRPGQLPQQQQQQQPPIDARG